MTGTRCGRKRRRGEGRELCGCGRDEGGGVSAQSHGIHSTERSDLLKARYGRVHVGIDSIRGNVDYSFITYTIPFMMMSRFPTSVTVWEI